MTHNVEADIHLRDVTEVDITLSDDNTGFWISFRCKDKAYKNLDISTRAITVFVHHKDTNAFPKFIMHELNKGSGKKQLEEFTSRILRGMRKSSYKQWNDIGQAIPYGENL